MSKGVFDSTIGALNTSLNLRLLNQNIIGSNIANADTPNYKAKAVEFEQAFREALEAGEPLPVAVSDKNHISPRDTDPVYPEVYEPDTGSESLDGNTVNRSAEMAKMAENKLLYDASVEMLRKKLAILKYAANDGGGQ